MSLNGCINILSSRKRCLPICLDSLWKKWNHRYEYPVYVHYFDDIYDSEAYREMVRSNISQNIHFRPIQYKTPAHIPEEELFYNRKDLWYAQARFSIARKGYLHMCHYFNNLYEYPDTDLHTHDYIMSIDDEALFTKEVPYDFFEVMKSREEMAGALKVTRAIDKPPKQGNFDCRVGLWDHLKTYMATHNITPKSPFLQDLLIDPNAEANFHNFTYADSYVFKTELFRTPEWIQWNSALNASGGIYKYRWGDHILNSLFFLIHYGYTVYDFKTVDEGYHNQGGLRHIEDYAPSVKDIRK